MLMWHTPSVQAEEVEAFAAHARGVAECLLRTDNKGSVILCERGKAPKGVVEKRLAPLLSAGRFGPDAGPWIFWSESGRPLIGAKSFARGISASMAR
ncbi:MAG TPA: hypothetical protein VNA44_11415, partial [Burkholderiaceae bacterium]|nr:hypothetical protein [Burkholderiaceae bacterium]